MMGKEFIAYKRKHSGYQDYWLLFCMVHGYSPAITTVNVKFMTWIQGKHQEFRKLRGVDCPYIGYRADFWKWLLSVTEKKENTVVGEEAL